ncbi:MAG TPA: hypothetical protein VK665_17190 [Candidatus Elarobacter sp.]|nr:hypothetical protein [Candidatus Elarobacter sp.]
MAIGAGGAATDPRCDVLIVTVTDVETQAVLRSAETATGRPYTKHFAGRKTYYNVGPIAETSIVVVRSEMSSSSLGGSLVTVLHSIPLLQPHCVIVAGIAFGMDEPKQQIGTVLVSKQIHNYDLARIGTGEEGDVHVISRGDRPPASTLLLDRFRDGSLTWTASPVEFGLLLSGSGLIDNLDFREKLRTLAPEAIGGEMEGAGAYVGAETHKVDWIVVKAVCDYADGRKREQKEARQLKAARCASDFVFHVISQGGLAWNVVADGRDRMTLHSLDQPLTLPNQRQDAVPIEAPTVRDQLRLPAAETALPPEADRAGWRLGAHLKRLLDFASGPKAKKRYAVERSPDEEPRSRLYDALATLRGDFAVENVSTKVIVQREGAVTVDSRIRYRAFSQGFQSVTNRESWEAEIMAGSRFLVEQSPIAAGEPLLLGPTTGSEQSQHFVEWVLEFPHAVPPGEELDVRFQYRTKPNAARFSDGDVDEYFYDVYSPTKSIEFVVVPAGDAQFTLLDPRALVSLPGTNPLLNHREAARVNIDPVGRGFRYHVPYPLPGSSLRFIWAVAALP